MLEQYFVRPTTVDRIRAFWIGEAIEQYVSWLTEQGYSALNVPQRVPLLLHFGEYAREQGAATWDVLLKHVEPFVHQWVNSRVQPFPNDESRDQSIRSVRGPICQFLRVVLPDYRGGIRGRGLPRFRLLCSPVTSHNGNSQ